MMQWFRTHIRSALLKIRKTGDVIDDDDDVFNLLSASRLASHPPNAYSPELVQFVQRSQTVQVPPPIHPSPSPFRSAPLSSPSQPFIISFVRLPTSDSDSRMGPQFGQSQEEIAFLWGRQKLLQSPTSWTSDDESALAFHGSIFDPRGETFSCFS